MTTPEMPAIVVDHELDTVTFAVTFRWNRPWAMGHYEVGTLRGDLVRLLVKHYGDPEWDQLRGLEAVQTWEPREERHIGKPSVHARFPFKRGE